MRFLDFAAIIRFIDNYVVGSILPRFSIPLTHNSDLENSEGIRRLRFRIFRCLVGNLSFLVEPVFRVRLYLALRSWVSSEATYRDTQSALRKAINSKRIFGRLPLPRYGISRSLQSVGFFSLSYILESKPGGSTYLSAITFVRKLRAPIREGGRHANLDLSVSRRTRKRVNVKDTVSAAVIGPGNHPSTMMLQSYENVVFLVTPSVSPNDLLQRLNSSSSIVSLNGEVSADLVRNGDRSKWWESICEASLVLCEESDVNALRKILRQEIVGFDREISQRWGNSLPTLLPKTLETKVLSSFRFCLYGIDLYTGARPYAKEPPYEQDGDFYDFRLTRNVAYHDPARHFRYLRELYEAGRVTGNETLIQLLKMDEAGYLCRLDEVLGMQRS